MVIWIRLTAFVQVSRSPVGWVFLVVCPENWAEDEDADSGFLALVLDRSGVQLRFDPIQAVEEVERTMGGDLGLASLRSQDCLCMEAMNRM